MKASGLSKEDLALIVELEEMEKIFTDKDFTGEPKTIAKAMTCLAYDYCAMGLEERGHELLVKADQIYPDYYKYQVLLDAQEPEFGLLVHSLAKELILIALETAKSNKPYKK